MYVVVVVVILVTVTTSSNILLSIVTDLLNIFTLNFN